MRLLPPESFGAAMQYFTGSKAHNVALRQRALKMGYTLSEYSLAKLEDEKPVAGKTEEEIYAKLNLDYIPPEMRENWAKSTLPPKHTLPKLITQADLQGDVHMHTVETDGRNTIEEMAEAAPGARLQVHGHHRPLQESGLRQRARRQARARAHRAHSRGRMTRWTASRFSPGSKSTSSPTETLDLSDECWQQMDIVIASVHSHFNQEPGEDDRASAEGDRESQHVSHRTSHRASCCCAATLTTSTWTQS